MELKNITYDIEGTNEEISRVEYEFDFGKEPNRESDKLKKAVVSRIESIAKDQYDDGFIREEFPHITQSSAEKVVSYRNKTNGSIADVFKTSINIGLDENFETKGSSYLRVTNRGDFKKVVSTYKSIIDLPVDISEDAEKKLRNLDNFVKAYANK